MSVISVRVTEQERLALVKAATLFNCKVSSLIKKLVFERLEDEYDIQVIKEYEKEKESGALELFSLADVLKEVEK